MDIVYSPAHQAHRGEFEIFRGERVPCFETPERAEFVLSAVTGLGALIEPRTFPVERLERVHAVRYLRFLEHAWRDWTALGKSGDALPAVWPIRSFRSDLEPDDFVARLGLYSYDSGTPLTAGTWAAARAAASCALTGQQRLREGRRAAFALVRPPGHHAGTDFMGGYCFVNNAAVAAQACLDDGAARVAILDVDYHHGNGTQQIFYARADVLCQSIHGDPRTEYPFFLGHADETGEGAGLGFNQNYPLPAGSSNEPWFDALEQACRRIAAYGPEALVVSLGVDTYLNDPISKFRLDAPQFRQLGARLAALKRPTLFVLEGGYAVAEIGLNVAAVLRGFEDA